jgi:ATP-dependent DNA helicase RecG
LGTAQSGLPPLRIGSLLRDADLMLQAREAAFVVIAGDPKLERPAHHIFRSLLGSPRKADLSQVS